MKKYTDSFNKYNLTLNNSKNKSNLTILTIGLFIFLGFASIEEGNPDIQTVNCDFFHSPVVVTHNCKFSAFFFDLEGNNEAPEPFIMTLQISKYEKADDNGVCFLALKTTEAQSLAFDSFGNANIILSKSYISDDDEIQVSFMPIVIGYYQNSYTLIIHKVDKDIKYSINLRKINPSP